MAVSLSDQVTTRRLVAVANSKVEYEDVAGSLVAITNATDVDTTDQLVMFEAFQKAIVVNGAILRVADFINTKLSTADVRPNDSTNVAPMKGTILTGGTSGATMVVDYCSANNGAAFIYGYTTSAATFDESSEVVTGTNASGTPTTVSFTLNATPAEASTMPHWYNYTVYPTIGGVSFGSLPAKAYLGCLYRGRVVLSGNPNYPHQWYMSRQSDIWDYAYLANDAQSPVVGNNADAGECGDIIRCLIPYKDDYLIFGCATTIWVLRGDPAAGGSLDEVDLTIGIFGANSWCFDGDGNLYFWGTGGIYVLPTGFGKIKNLTENTLPAIVADEDVDPSTHRITMGYDRKRRGILVCITKLSDGSNSNYWYDLRTGGFFPETYPDVCGAYSLFYYAANDKDYADLLLGCKDGYVRKFLDTAKDDDDGVGADTAINSYCTLPIQPLSPDGDHEGKLTSLTVTNAGGASGGDFGDTDEVDYSLYVGNDAEIVLEDIIDGATARETGTLSGTGRKERVRHRLRGAYLGIKLANSTAAETWAIEKIEGEVQPAGKIK